MNAIPWCPVWLEIITLLSLNYTVLLSGGPKKDQDPDLQHMADNCIWSQSIPWGITVNAIPLCPVWLENITLLSWNYTVLLSGGSKKDLLCSICVRLLNMSTICKIFLGGLLCMPYPFARWSQDLVQYLYKTSVCANFAVRFDWSGPIVPIRSESN